MSSSPPNPSGSKFTAGGVREYERKRYRGIDQRIVHGRENRMIAKCLAAVRESVPSGRAARFLDLPCGYGRFTGLLREKRGDVVVSDLSVEMVRRTRELTGSPGAAAHAARGLPFANGAFDAVVSIRFFHHLHSPEDRAAVLAEFARVSSGWAIVSFYRETGLHSTQRKLRRVFGKSRTNIIMLEKGIFEREAAAAGFAIAGVRPLFRGVHAYHLALLKKRRN
jgi:SAM-dependent methyltransferase